MRETEKRRFDDSWTYLSLQFTYAFRVFSMSIVLPFFLIFHVFDTLNAIRAYRAYEKIPLLRVFAVAHGVQVTMVIPGDQTPVRPVLRDPNRPASLRDRFN